MAAQNNFRQGAMPILPSYLYEIGKAPATTPGNGTGLTVNPPINQSLNRRSVMLGSTSVPPHQTPALSSNLTVAQNPESNCYNADAHLDEVNIKVGLMLASKSTIQLLINPFMGPLTDRIGYHIPMCAGFCIIVFSTTLFAFSSSFALLLLARSVQGVGGSCLSVAGMGMLADGYKDSKERGRAMGTSFTGLALGLIAGAPFGSLMYEFVGEMSPFLVLAVIAVLAGGLHAVVFQPSRVQTETGKGTPMLTLLKDPYIVIAAGAICLTTMVVATIETTLPVRMMKTMCSSKWQLGTVFLTDSISYLVVSNIFGHLSQKYSRRYARTHGVHTMTFDSEEELLKISRCHAKAKLVLRIAVDDSASKVRLSLKFGARLESVAKLLGRAGDLGLEVIGVSFHVGSGCTDSLAFRRAIADARRVFDLGNLLGLQMSLLDIGGGFSGIEDCLVEFEEFSEVINAALDEFFPPDSGVQIIAEPGRYFVDSAFTLAANVIGKKVIADDLDEHSDGEHNSPDRLMMYYLNDGVYGSMRCITNDAAHNRLEPYLHRVVESSEQRFRSVLWGPTCDSADKVTDSCWFPELDVGDWLLVDNMGAYSVIWCTDFNGFERAHIYPVVTAETWHTLNLSHTLNIRQ
ncbi:ornithine decarboxylase-like [Pseudoliparis swirei]|uniref:ornithine decarboxylase-like n=1 Tax=Pseudoliparis swirei TaxID=2059687 RepID=UPI0024BE2C10|nr:ornithine decarboxylase-like [Pseudoliparis swirei]